MMTLQPVLPWWGLLVVFMPLFGLSVWLLWRSRHQRSRRSAWVRRLILVILLLVVSLRPSVFGASRLAGSSMMDVFFVVDTTTSMIAEDYDGTNVRMSGVKNDVSAIADELVGARFSIFTFDNRTTRILPLTDDTSAVKSAIETISTQNVFYGIGSSIDQPLQEMQQELSRLSKSSPDRARIFFYIGDGEQTTDARPKSFDSLKSLIDGGAVLGYGTEQGGQMEEVVFVENVDSKSYVKDYSQNIYPVPNAVSKLDEDALKGIASQMGVSYFHRQNPDSVSQVTDGIKKVSTVKANRSIDSSNDMYWVFLFPVVAILGYELYGVSLSMYGFRKAMRKINE